jgi:RimJ/RimL family protein N-acetyltransferase
MTGRAHLRTARLVLRPLCASDEVDYVQALADPAVHAWLRDASEPFTAADFRAYLPQDWPGRRWAIEANGAMVGLITLDPQFGYWIAPRAQGRGYASEAARAVLAAHFADRDAPGLMTQHRAENVASARVLAKLGFQGCDGATGDRAQVERVLSRDDYVRANPLVIDTPRLRLDPLDPDDAEALRGIVTRPEVGRMLFLFPADWTLEAARAFVHDWRWTGARPFRLAIRREGRFIGAIGVGKGAAPPIYYFLDPAEAGRGLMQEAVNAFRDRILERFDLKALSADVFTDNPASARVLERAGFRRTGTAQGSSKQRPAPAPVWTYHFP